MTKQPINLLAFALILPHHSSMLSTADIIGVLVTYQPDEALIERLKGHLTQLDRLIVVENGFGKSASLELGKFAAENKQITLISLSDNHFAKAQNTGIQKAKELKAKAVLLLDDDSEMAPEMLQTLCEHLQAGIGLIAANMIERGTQAETRYVSQWFGPIFRLHSSGSEDIIDSVFNPIASGSLIPIDVIEQAGLMDENLQIDYVDREFCLRLLTRGYHTRIVSNAMLYHRVGHGKDHEVLGAAVTTRNHPAKRRYTIFRNRLRCWSRYGLSMPAFLCYDMLACLYDLFRIVCLEEDKAPKLLAAWHGTLAALTGHDHAEYR